MDGDAWLENDPSLSKQDSALHTKFSSQQSLLNYHNTLLATVPASKRDQAEVKNAESSSVMFSIDESSQQNVRGKQKEGVQNHFQSVNRDYPMFHNQDHHLHISDDYHHQNDDPPGSRREGSAALLE